MKRKYLEGLKIRQIKRKKGYTGACYSEGGYLVIDIYFDGKFQGRYAMDLQTKEYACLADGKWEQKKFSRLFGINPLYDYGDEEISSLKWDLPEDGQRCREATAGMGYRKSWWGKIRDEEEEFRREKRINEKRRKYQKAEELMSRVPEVPKGLEGWYIKDSKYYAFFNKEKDQCGCSSCGTEFSRGTGKKRLQHNEETICPGCGRKVTVKTRQKIIERKDACMILQDMGECGIARHFMIGHTHTYGKNNFRVEEKVRLLLKRPHNGVQIYYDQDGGGTEFWTGLHRPAWWTTNTQNKRIISCLLYPEGIREGLEKTSYEGLINAFQAMAAIRIKADYNNAMAAEAHNKNIGTVLEYLIKGRFFNMAKETMQLCTTGGGYYGKLNLHGKSLEEVFGIRDRQKINRIRQQDGGERMLEWMRYSEKTRNKINQEIMEKLEAWRLDAGMVERDLRQLSGKMSIEQIVHYLERQMKRYKDAETALNQWADYLTMCEATGKKMDEPLIYKPADLKKRHDEIITEKQKLEAVKRLRENREQRRKEAEKMREKFPEAEEILKEVGEKYSFEEEDYIMRIPRDLVEIVEEGYALHHCGGSSDRYFNRICNRETYIGFLRRTGEPDIPFYTIEFEPDGTIRQSRSYYDEEPGIEEIRGFLRLWQREIKKRMTGKDREDARRSADLRKKNIAELKEKRNTFVLQKLMEDFMEAG